ncbi:MAG TPA: hypothetical protein VF796_16295 [Humisphaera sp.]
MPRLPTLLAALLALSATSRAADRQDKPSAPALTSATQPAAFRTDANDDPKLPWFAPKPGEFPPAGSAHSIAGELIAVDHVNRTGVLRPDRTDAQKRGDWDRPLPFALLPYGAVRYHGAPADLRDVPIGTHLYGQFYVGEPPASADPKAKARPAIEAAFSRVLLLEDDFSRAARLGRKWRVEAVNLEAGTLATTIVGPDAPKATKPTVYQVNPATRVWKGRSVGTLADVQPGSEVVLNLTVCTLKGPGRVTNVWLDDESRAVATAQQAEVHRQHQREHGLAGYVTEVDNKAGLVTVTLFDAFDPKLLEDFAPNDSVTAACAEENLRTWDQINDRKAGPLIEIKKGTPAVGSSGVQVRFKPAVLLEGFRPKRVVRVWPGKWKVDDLPLEERLYP